MTLAAPAPDGEPPSGDRPLSAAEVFDREAIYVWSFLRRIGIPAGDLEDLTQDVFLTFFERLDRFDFGRPVRPWLLGIAFRVALDFRRLAQHRKEVFNEPGALACADGRPDAAAVYERRELVARALAQVPLERRGVLMLYELYDETVAQIAEVLAIPVNTVYSRLRVARAEFAAAVARLEEGVDGPG